MKGFLLVCCCILGVLLLNVERGATFSCPCWRWSPKEREDYCTELTDSDCPRGVGSDSCGCCDRCLKDVGERCGGSWLAGGECGEGLVCARLGRPQRGWWTEVKHIANLRDGTCIEKGELVETGAPCGSDNQCEEGETCQYLDSETGEPTLLSPYGHCVAISR